MHSFFSRRTKVLNLQPTNFEKYPSIINIIFPCLKDILNNIFNCILKRDFMFHVVMSKLAEKGDWFSIWFTEWRGGGGCKGEYNPASKSYPTCKEKSKIIS